MQNFYRATGTYYLTLGAMKMLSVLFRLASGGWPLLGHYTASKSKHQDSGIGNGTFHSVKPFIRALLANVRIQRVKADNETGKVLWCSVCRHDRRRERNCKADGADGKESSPESVDLRKCRDYSSDRNGAETKRQCKEQAAGQVCDRAGGLKRGNNTRHNCRKQSDESKSLLERQHRMSRKKQSRGDELANTDNAADNPAAAKKY
jgi:hypothetical protein